MQIINIADKQKWEKFIAKVSPQSFFQSWNWGEACKIDHDLHSKPHRLWRVGLEDNNNLLAIAQIIKVQAKRGVFLHIRHGPVLLSWEQRILNKIVSYLRELARSERASFIRISPLIDYTPANNSLLQNKSFRDAPIAQMDGEYCWNIDLQPDLDDILHSMRKTTRYLIRQALKLNITIEKSEDEDNFPDFMKLYHLTARRHQFIEHHGIREEFKLFKRDGQALWFKGFYQDKLVAMALIIFYNHQAIYHHSASIDQKIPVNYLLQWEVIQEAKKRNKQIYNMWGIAPEIKSRHPWRGLSLFKKGFGGYIKEYVHTKDLLISPKYYYTYMIELLRKKYKGF